MIGDSIREDTAQVDGDSASVRVGGPDNDDDGQDVVVPFSTFELRIAKRFCGQAATLPTPSHLFSLVVRAPGNGHTEWFNAMK
ncbi:hypothetical protein PF011_g13509 [Phytophthora fragariae]|uniref:Uncharacterized protein n=1 Tax=Phytophthora fragariae TaxID=53985 RepID=A0A6A3K496_9STRA|nr:hypothetical protein PF011_g13509 [Phytophthora fragariae]